MQAGDGAAVDRAAYWTCIPHDDTIARDGETGEEDEEGAFENLLGRCIDHSGAAEGRPAALALGARVAHRGAGEALAGLFRVPLGGPDNTSGGDSSGDGGEDGQTLPAVVIGFGRPVSPVVNGSGGGWKEAQDFDQRRALVHALVLEEGEGEEGLAGLVGGEVLLARAVKKFITSRSSCVILSEDDDAVIAAATGYIVRASLVGFPPPSDSATMITFSKIYDQAIARLQATRIICGGRCDAWDVSLLSLRRDQALLGRDFHTASACNMLLYGATARIAKRQPYCNAHNRFRPMDYIAPHCTSGYFIVSTLPTLLGRLAGTSGRAHAIAASALADSMLALRRPENARRLLLKIKPTLERHGSPTERGDLRLRLAKCSMTEAGNCGSDWREESRATRRLLGEAAQHLKEAENFYHMVDMVGRLKEVYYLQAILYDVLEECVMQRNEAAQNFQKMCMAIHVL
mmetsp:Transcript_8305/g.18119  ORF Transcript_8305/g.18119 Transcript_8305/m.18119 type:complete len:459 (-) Transcript_8305:182-1558(-)